jgi:hypothetical protein
MKKLLLLTVFVALAAGAIADDLIEPFDDPLGQWRDNWLALNSNMQNWYVDQGDPNEDNRGNNPCGLWISDGDPGNTDCSITFDAGFGAGVTYFEISLEIAVDLTLSIYDVDGNLTTSEFIPANYAGGEWACGAVPFGYATPNGLGYFTMTGAYVEGNTAIDNVKVTTGTTGTEDTTWGAIKSLYR